MPYILRTNREPYDAGITQLLGQLESLDNNKLSGELNYVISSICAELITGQDYARMAVVLSAVHEAEAELRRRWLAPYEDGKRIKNGDII